MKIKIKEKRVIQYEIIDGKGRSTVAYGTIEEAQNVARKQLLRNYLISKDLDLDSMVSFADDPDEATVDVDDFMRILMNNWPKFREIMEESIEIEGLDDGKEQRKIEV